MNEFRIEIIPAQAGFYVIYWCEGEADEKSYYLRGDAVIAWRVEISNANRARRDDSSHTMVWPITPDGDTAFNYWGIENPDGTVLATGEGRTFPSFDDIEKVYQKERDEMMAKIDQEESAHDGSTQ